MSASTLRIGLSRNLEDVRSASGQVRLWAERQLGEVMAGAFELAFVEAATNAVLHAPAEAADTFCVHLTETETECVLELVDEGWEMPEEALLRVGHAERRLAECYASPGGRGLLLISALMDRVDYRCASGQSRLEMAMHRPSPSKP